LSYLAMDDETNTAPRPAPNLKRRLILSDIAASIVGWVVPMLAAPIVVHGVVDLRYRLAWALIGASATLVFIALQDMYLARVCMVRWAEAQGVARSVIGAGVVMVMIEQLVRADLPLREVTTAGVAALAAVLCARALFQGWLRRQRAEGRFVRDLILVGADADAVQLAAVMREHPELGYRARGYVGDPGYGDVLQAPWLGDVDRVAHAIEETGSSGALVVASALSSQTLNDVVRQLLARDINVQLSSGLRGIAQERFRATPLAYEPLFFIEPLSLSSWQLTIKRIADVATAVIALVVFAPLFAVIGLAIKLDSPGPVLFRQQRVGRDGALFTLLKFRTMTIDAEARQDVLLSNNERTDGPLFKMASDPRITRLGKVLRSSSLDELPQLINVLFGSMSLVGPRPALPDEVARFDEQLKMRARVTPGMTGLWQIEARDNPAFGPYRRLDLFYVENWSPFLDIRIVVATFFHLVGRTLRHLKGAVASEPAPAGPVPQSGGGVGQPDEPELIFARRVRS
jgi:exopolysaccharide biosynthesis polyprenyl glycosylphosphotransferase